MVRQIVEQADQSDLNCPPTPDSPAPPLTNLDILEEVAERLAYLEAFEDETPLPSLCKISLAQMFSSETQSLFLTKGTKRPRLMTFELELSQPGMTEMKSRIMVDSGSTFTIMSKDVALRRGYALEPLDESVSVALADGSVKKITHQAKLTTHFLDKPRILEFLILDIAGFDAIIGMDFLEQYDPDISWNRHTLRFRDSKVIHWGIQKSPAQRKLDATLNSISAAELSSAQGKGAAHIVSIQEYINQPLFLQYPSIALSTPGYLAVIMPCEEGGAEHADHLSAVVSTEGQAVQKDPDKPATFDEFLDKLAPRG
jgi:hypothetical protein